MQNQSKVGSSFYEALLSRMIGRKIYREFVVHCSRVPVEPERYFDIYMELHFIDLPTATALQIWRMFLTLLLDDMVLRKAIHRREIDG